MLLSKLERRSIEGADIMEIQVCIGSSCHLKGSYDVIKKLESLIKENGMEEKINLNAAFCLGKCTNGVTIKVDEDIITGTSKENIEEIFNKNILGKVE